MWLTFRKDKINFKIIVIYSLFILMPILIACGSSESDGDSGKRQFLSVGTAPPGGAFFPVGSAISSTWKGKK